MLERHMREEGFKNREDIFDQPTFEDIEDQIDKESYLVLDYVENKNSPIYAEVMRIIHKMCSAYREEFHKESIAYYEKHGKLHPGILEFLADKKMDQLRIELYDSAGSEQWFETHEFYETIAEGNILIIINLPKPLSVFWKKNGEQPWAKQSVDIENSAIEWGYLYEKLMPVVWCAYDSNTKVHLQRLNDLADHDPKAYYYVWEAGPGIPVGENNIDW